MSTIHFSDRSPLPMKLVTQIMWIGVGTSLSTGPEIITSHGLREYEKEKLRSLAFCRQENAIFSPHIHATDGK